MSFAHPVWVTASKESQRPYMFRIGSEIERFRLPPVWLSFRLCSCNLYVENVVTDSWTLGIRIANLSIES